MLKADRLTYELGYCVREFVQVLPRAMRDWRVRSVSRNRWLITNSPQSDVVNVEVSSAPSRVLGVLELPTLLVTVRFLTDSSDLRAEFLRRFHRGFQKGGG